MSADPNRPGPPMLEDVVVLDIGDESTALAGELLAELGATVIRVEDARGDELRTRGPLWNAVFNSGKRSVAIDTSSDAAWAPVLDWLPALDVVIGPIEANGATRRFLDAVRAATAELPTLGFVEIVFRRGRDPEPVTDLTLTAAGGLTWLCGESDDPPNQPAGDLGWKQTSLAAAEAALALVTCCRRTGRAGHIVVSAQEAVTLTTLQTANGNIHHWHGRVPDRHTKLSAFTTVASSDSRWTSFTIHPPNWPRFVEWAEEVLGGSGLDGPEWADLDYIAANRSRVADVVARLAARLTQTDLVQEGQSRGLLVLPVNEVDDVIADRHLAARGFWVEVEAEGAGQSGEGARATLAGSVFRSDQGRMARRPAPRIGADNDLLSAFERPVPRATSSHSDSPTDGVGRPLEGIRVVDFCWAIAGSLSTRLLADLGADVIKLESNNRTDPIRYIGPQPAGREGSMDTNGVFNDCSANKRAVTLNVDTEAGRDLARRLIATADVLTANYTPDRLDRWGFDRDSLQTLRPGLIVANLAVMGTWGPDSGWRSYGSGLVAMSGLAAHTGFEGQVPECLGTLHTDFTVPYFAAMQILAALHHRSRTGEGAYLELSQYESAVRLLDLELAEVLNGGNGPGHRANRSPWAQPHGVFQARGDDRWVAIAARSDAERDQLAFVIDAPAPPEQTSATDADPSRAEPTSTTDADPSRAGAADGDQSRPEPTTTTDADPSRPGAADGDRSRPWAVSGHRGRAPISGSDLLGERGEQLVAAWAALRTREEIVAALRAVQVPVSAVEDLADHQRDPAMSRFWATLELPAGVSAKVVHEPITWDGERLPLHPAPMWFEHTYEVLVDELGVGPDEFAALLAEGVLS